MSFRSKRTIVKDVAPNSGNGTNGISSQLDTLQVQSPSTIRRASHSQNQVHDQVESEASHSQNHLGDVSKETTYHNPSLAKKDPPSQAHKASLSQGSVVPKIAPNFGPFGISVSQKNGQPSMSQKIQGKGQVTHEGMIGVNHEIPLTSKHASLLAKASQVPHMSDKQGFDSQPHQRRAQESSLESGKQHPQETTPRIDGQKSSMESAITGKGGLASQPSQRQAQKSSMDCEQQQRPPHTTPRIDLQIPQSSARRSSTSLVPNASQSHLFGKGLASQPSQRHGDKSSMESKQQRHQQQTTTSIIDHQMPSSSIRRPPSSLMPNASQAHLLGNRGLASQPPQRHAQKSSEEQGASRTTPRIDACDNDADMSVPISSASFRVTNATNGGTRLNVDDGATGGIHTLRRSRNSSTQIPDWPDHRRVEYDDKEEVLVVDDSGNIVDRIKKKIFPRDVWLLKPGIKYHVRFNEFNQPLRKGGFIFVRFLGNMARNGRYCPIGVADWRKLAKQYKVDIVETVRAKFALPDDYIYDEAILKHVNKMWKGYKYELKSMYFKPNKSQEGIIRDVPPGLNRDQWILLVGYWFSEHGKTLSDLGKKARTFHSHAHTTGSTSYANKRLDFEETHKRPPSCLELFRETHTKKDGGYVAETATEKFLETANAEVEKRLQNNGSSKSRMEVENEVFDHLMYDPNEPNQRPVGYGFGVNRGDIFGVKGELRKRGYCASSNNLVEIENVKRKMARFKRCLDSKYDQSINIMKQLLSALRDGKISNSMLDVAEDMINKINSDKDATDGFDSDDEPFLDDSGTMEADPSTSS